ncbi:MAG TPA: ribonuclease HI family protein [Candidatus Acidoferrales bacterium]|nr:ribonuclease HI family protein [Candidatus Acidoferrales bacterium]
MTKRESKSSPPASARLFVESHPAPPAGVHLAHIDGASRGNPGPAAYALIVRRPDGSKLVEIGKRIGRETNNVAEYYGLIAALDYAVNHGIHALRIRSDSELLVRQMQGHYKVKNADLKPLFERAQKLARWLEYFAIEHVPREANRDADALANLALDGMGSPAPEKPQPLKTTAESSAKPRQFRARLAGGKLVPDEPLDFPEGTSFDVELHNPIKH